MFDIPFHINLFISLIEQEHPLKISNKRTHIALPVSFFNWSRESLKKYQIEEYTGRYKIVKITYTYVVV